MHETDYSFFKRHFVLVSLLESREICEWGAKPKCLWVGNLPGGQHLYPSPPGHVFSAALWHWSSSGTRGISRPGSLAGWRKRQLYHEQAGKRATTADGREEETHSGLCWMTSCQLAFLEKTVDLPYNYMHPSYFSFRPAQRILLRNLWRTRGTVPARHTAQLLTREIRLRCAGQRRGWTAAGSFAGWFKGSSDTSPLPCHLFHHDTSLSQQRAYLWKPSLHKSCTFNVKVQVRAESLEFTLFNIFCKINYWSFDEINWPYNKASKNAISVNL